MRQRGPEKAEVMKLGEAGQFLRVSDRTLREMARTGRVPAQKVGREWRFLRGALKEWLGGQAKTVREPSAAYSQKRLFEEAPSPAKADGLKVFGDTAFACNRREPLHRWVPWIAGFSAAFVEDMLKTYIPGAGSKATVLDPFAGVGTTLVEGLKRGHNVVGFEVNPYAALVCRTKLSSLHVDLNQLSRVIQRFSAFMREKIENPRAKPESVPPPRFRSNAPFFSPEVERQVLFAMDFMGAERDDLLRSLLELALASVMVGVSNYSYEPSLGTRSAAGKDDVHRADVTAVVCHKLWEMEADIGYLQRHMERFNYEPRVQVEGVSYLAAARSLPNGSVDILITSPPYLNNYHYVRNTRPQLYWIGLVEEPKDTKSIELDSFGQFWQTVRSGPQIDLKPAIPGLREVIDRVRERNSDKGDYGGAGWAKYAAAYFNDCDRFCAVTKRIMKPGARAIIVLGNSILQGVEVKTDEFFAQIAQRRGFELVGLHKVRSKRTGSSIVNSSVRAGTLKKRVPLYETAVELLSP